MSEPQILGRQPAQLQFTPSKPNPWYGSIIEGQRFTLEQINALKRADKDPETVETITVRRNSTHRENWWPSTAPTPQYQFDCPVISRAREGRAGVISPSGLTALVDADGFAGRQK